MLTAVLPDLRSGASHRPRQPADEAFLRDLFVADRLPGFLEGGLTEPVARDLLADQFRLQSTAYAQTYATLDDRVLLAAGAPVGRCLVAQEPDHLVLVDLLVHPDHRGRGIGTAALRRVQARARNARVRVELSVVPGNPAQQLYEREGFRPSGLRDDRVRMCWSPS